MDREKRETMILNVSVAYTEQELTADEVERKLGSNTLDWGTEEVDEREPEIWLSEMYETGFNMACLEGVVYEFPTWDKYGKEPHVVILKK